MKTSINLFLLISGIIFSCKAQNAQHVFKWEASTICGGVFIGITNTKKQALLKIEQLMAEKTGNHDIVDFEIRFSSISASHNTYDDFLALTPDRIGFVFLTQEDLEVIRINKKWGKSISSQYYNKTNNFKNEKTMLHHLENDVLVYEKFLFTINGAKSNNDLYTSSTKPKSKKETPSCKTEKL